MTDTRPRRPRDANQRAKSIVDIATGDTEEDNTEGKDPSAVERGRKGGKVGGKERAIRMSAEERREASRKAAQAAQARWSR